MKYIKILLVLLTILIPNISLAAFPVGWSATSTTQGWISPNKISNVLQTIFAGDIIADLITASSFTATSTTVASTFPKASSTQQTVSGSFWANSGGITSDSTTGSTTISQLYTGNIEAEPDAGAIQFFNLPVVSASNQTPQIFSLGINSNASTSISVGGKSNGAGNVTNFFLGVATSTQFDSRDIFNIDGSLTGNATTTVNFNAGSADKTCFNTTNSSGTNISFYFVGTTMVIENNICR